jgi:predicted NUDIX family NTP pyrophosphohydrolase
MVGVRDATGVTVDHDRKAQATGPGMTNADYIAMPRHSAGLLMYRSRDSLLEVLLVHPGGPLWANKDTGAWSIPKGEYTTPEDPLPVAQREFHEETGYTAGGPFLPLSSVKQSGGKVVTAWAFEGNCDASAIHSNSFTMEWPPKSGTYQSFPEVDRAAWYTLDEAREKINPAQRAFLDDLEQQISL